MPRKKPLSYPSAVPDVPHKYRMRLCRTLFMLPYTPMRCQLWDKYKDEKGYGQIRLNRNGPMVWAHRAYYAMFIAPIPEGMTVHHRCGNPSCVNPEHLELATVAENTAEGNRRRVKDGIVNDIPF